MSYRITHISPAVWGMGLKQREQVVHFDATEDGRTPALARFDAYLAEWEAVDPENRFVQKKGHIKAYLYERPAGCECRVCTAWNPEQPERHWSYWGTHGGHDQTFARVTRLDEAAPRSKTPTWRVVRRPVNANANAYEIVSSHFTKSAARSGLHVAVRDWRRGQSHTATQQGENGYLLKQRTVGRYRLDVERVTPLATELARDTATRRLTAFSTFAALLGAGGRYLPTIAVSRGPEYLDLADAYDAAQEARGDDRRAHRL